MFLHDDDARLTQLREQLKAEGWAPEDVPPYQELWLGALNGIYPVHQKNGRWYFSRKNTSAIARALRLRRVTLTGGGNERGE